MSDKYRSGCTQLPETKPPTKVYTLTDPAAYVAEDGLVSHHWEERLLVFRRQYASVQGNAKARKQDLVDWGAGQKEGIGNFQDSI